MGIKGTVSEISSETSCKVELWKLNTFKPKKQGIPSGLKGYRGVNKEFVYGGFPENLRLLSLKVLKTKWSLAFFQQSLFLSKLEICSNFVKTDLEYHFHNKSNSFGRYLSEFQIYEYRARVFIMSYSQHI